MFLNFTMRYQAIFLWTPFYFLLKVLNTSAMYNPMVWQSTNNEHEGINIMVLGGNYFNDTWFSELSDVELLDPFWSNSRCAKPQNIPFDVDGMISINVKDQPIICGGLQLQFNETHEFERKVSNDCHKLDNNEWNLVNSTLTCPRWGASSVILNNGTVWVLGGNPDSSSSEECLGTAASSEIYNSNKEEFEISAILPEPMVYHCTVKLDEDHIFVVNGYDENYEGVSHAYIVDISIEPFTFTPLPSLNKVRSEAACGLIKYQTTTKNQNDLAIVVAGGGFGETSTSTEIYRWSNNSNSLNVWEPGPVLPRGFANGCQVNSEVDHFILIGGFDEDGAIQSDLIHYNTNSERFEILPTRLNIPRYGCTAVSLKNTGDCVRHSCNHKR